MRVLFISLCYPWPLTSGGPLRNFHLVQHLAERHEVTLVSLLYGAEPGFCDRDSPLGALCREVVVFPWKELLSPTDQQRFHSFAPLRQRLWNLATWPYSSEAGAWRSPQLVSHLQEIRRRVQPDVTWVDRSFVAESAKQAGLKNITVDVDDLLAVMRWRELRHSPWYRSKPLHYLEWLKLAWYERSLPHRFDRVVVCKREDARLFPGGRRNVFVVPNGTRVVPPCDPALEQADALAFVGMLGYPPNHDAVTWFVREIWPQIRVRRLAPRFVAVGRQPQDELRALAGGPIEIIGDVPSVRPYYERASVVVSPLRLGSGTKLKVLEALAHRKALVATPQAVEGLDLRPGIDFELARSPVAFAQACSALLADPQRRQALAEAGYERVVARYDWNAIAATSEVALGLTPTQVCQPPRQSGDESVMCSQTAGAPS